MADPTIMEYALMYIDYLNSPIGLVEIEASEQGINRVDFVDTETQSINTNSHTDMCRQQLEEYFTSTRRTFDLTLDQQRGTDFQRSVWERLLEIPYGEQRAYRDIAEALNNPKAVRAVGAANGRNPIAIIVPCHRVIGSNGTLTGYASGLERKAWLLKHEGITLL
uniref:Methylated-DNA--protein-cysteine methyltransferase n=1 Tax=uncultured Thiotrichaceae bacterium TaxID=298394 RepID=A0A6S6UDR8_9GAMM|nr:MAG: Methylated-DNA--protein-cysteine methyltransferase (EC [uncultured Thiotrichaceae bacterium]